MQYLILLLLIFVAVAIIVTLLPYVSLIITSINNVNARVYTLYNSSVYMSGTWLVNGSKIQQVLHHHQTSSLLRLHKVLMFMFLTKRGVKCCLITVITDLYSHLMLHLTSRLVITSLTFLRKLLTSNSLFSVCYRVWRSS